MWRAGRVKVELYTDDFGRPYVIIETYANDTDPVALQETKIWADEILVGDYRKGAGVEK